MTTGILHDQNLEKHIQKQMGCMTGFLHLFDRNQIFSGKRLYCTTKRLPPALDSALESPSISTELAKVNQNTRSAPSPVRYKHHCASAKLRSPVPVAFTPAQSPSKMPLPLPIFYFKEGTKSAWKFRETPRLSLDSRAIVDAKGSLHPRQIRINATVCDDNDNQHRSPSVIARLMGLEQLPESHPDSMMKKSELRRSASESRVNRDLNNQYRFMDANNSFQQTQRRADSRSNSRLQEQKLNARNVDSTADYNTRRIIKSEPVKVSQRGSNNVLPQGKSTQKQPKSFFDAEDCFPEPKQSCVSIYGEIEKRLRMRGIDEPSKDLETLKQILDALQLKGLLHSKKSFEDQLNSRNFISNNMESPIVLMKPSSPKSRRNGCESRNYSSNPVQRRNLNRTGEGTNSPRVKTASSPSRSESSVTGTTSLVVKRKPLTIEAPRRGSHSLGHRRSQGSPVHSPKVFTRKHVSSSSSDRTQSPRGRKLTSSIHPKETLLVLTEDESSSSSDSMSSQTDSEKRKIEEFKDGRNLLDRCDKLLHSIAEMNTPELHPSPVSVLDSSFYKDDSSSPSPVLKRALTFKDQAVDFEDEIWSTLISPIESKYNQNMNNSDYVYISDVFRAFTYFPEERDMFLLLEKQQYHKGKNTSKVGKLERKIIFDTINEISDRNKQIPPWKQAITLMSSGTGALSLDQIWSEFKKIREHDESEDLFEVIFGVLRKDLDGDAINGWGDSYVEKSEAILDIERSIFKDLIGEMIRDLATVVVKGRSSISRRRLEFWK